MQHCRTKYLVCIASQAPCQHKQPPVSWGSSPAEKLSGWSCPTKAGYDVQRPTCEKGERKDLALLSGPWRKPERSNRSWPVGISADLQQILIGIKKANAEGNDLGYQ